MPYATAQHDDALQATRDGARHARELAMLTNDQRMRAELLRVAAEMDAEANREAANRGVDHIERN